MPNPRAVVILAAGKGTRMRSGLPKVLHPLGGWPLIRHVAALATRLELAPQILVVAPGSAEVAAAAALAAPGVVAVQQDPPQGTGHAVRVALPALPEAGVVIVLYGDTPLLQDATALALIAAVEAGAAVSVLGIRPPDGAGYGRLLVDSDGLQAIVEARHASVQLLAEGLCNAGVMAFDATRLRELLTALPHRPEKDEYYLTDAVALARARGWRCTAVQGPAEDGLGINDQAQLAAAEAVFQARARAALLAAGVIMPAPETVHLAAGTTVAAGALIEPFVVLGPGVEIAAGARIRSFSHLEGASVGAGAEVGPHARLRPGTRLGSGVKVGNFVEVKNASVEEGAKLSHLSYIGDASVGAGSNLGAGTVTCNYDGVAKHRTVIGKEVFVGSNATLVAPLTVGDGAFVAAGSTLTEAVPADALAFGRQRQVNLLGRARLLRAKLLARRR